MNHLLSQLTQKSNEGKRSLGILIDPDKVSDNSACLRVINMCVENKVDYILVGGSLMTKNNFSQIIQLIKANSSIPVIIFPGNYYQIDSNADAILFLSLISGRNPEYLIGQHVIAAPILKRTHLEVIPVGYMLVNSGHATAASYISNTTPIPTDKVSIAVSTAMAGEMLGLQIIYMDAGSGAEAPIPPKVITAVKKNINVPLIVGGGISSVHLAIQALQAGADMLILGNSVEENPNLLIEVSERIHHLNQKPLNIN
ncbi:geranylgeranylglyceryl/heptaprenylglyceryl phosphate synthase [Imperialibacter roseus]|uniref:Geranylgeranylglyceryl phosphate synthase n=1 Tax=Imperialibacter roseus TaxID=1324217 RepID=A0ABZ0INX7_9BACT|nr:geranylgeranylglyceryl/heptaprenylglyceryl phosphate synthase [Imperialibacter roseus]WOK06733.1 geranylgeranylglyceryl/heptaprenylglyceryl phosphate synthase [Imperialibacter roseus]